MNTKNSFETGKRWRRVGRILRAILFILLVLSIGMWGLGKILKSNMLKQYPPPDPVVDVSGHHAHIHCTGGGSPTVILEAGLDDFSIFWTLVQPEASEVTRVCSYDRAGLGWSDPGPNPRTSETLVEELHLLLANANIEPPVVLVGHSFGGALMRLYAQNYPDEVVGMVLVDAAPDDLFIRIPRWRDAIDNKLGLYRMLSSLSSFGMLAFTPQSIPNRGMPDDVLAQYRAIAVSTGYFKTAVAENQAFENNLAAVRSANVNLGDMPLVVISRGYWDPMPGFSESENQQAWNMWQELQSQMISLSSNSMQIIATESEHHIQLQQPILVIDAIKCVVEAVQQQKK